MAHLYKCGHFVQISHHNLRQGLCSILASDKRLLKYREGGPSLSNTMVDGPLGSVIIRQIH